MLNIYKLFLYLVRCIYLKKSYVLGVLFIVVLALALSGCSGTMTPGPQSATNTPAPASASTSVGMSKSNPAPLGTTVEFTKPLVKSIISGGYGADISGDYSAKLTILEIKRGADAQKLLEKTNPGGTNNLDEGMELFAAKVKFELVKMPDKDHTYHTATEAFSILSKGKVIKDYFWINIRPTLGSDLYEGGSEEAWIMLACEKDDANPLLVYELNDGGTGGIWFKTTT